MGQKKEERGKNKEESTPPPTSTTVVLKVDIHCEGCASRIVKCISGFQGVESLKTESEMRKLTITGNVNPVKLRDKLTHKIKKSVELISPLSKNMDKENKLKNNNDKSNDKKPKEAPMMTVVLKVPLLCPCQGCQDKIRKMVLRTKGVHNVDVDREKGMLTVKGTMDVKVLAEKLSKKCKKKVEVVPPKKEKEKGKKEKEMEGEKEGDKGGNNNDTAKKKKKRGGGGGSGGGGDWGDNDKGGGNGQENMEQSTMDYTIPAYGYCYGGCGNDNYMGHYYPVSQIFSDENPYACCIM